MIILRNIFSAPGMPVSSYPFVPIFLRIAVQSLNSGTLHLLSYIEHTNTSTTVAVIYTLHRRTQAVQERLDNLMHA